MELDQSSPEKLVTYWRTQIEKEQKSHSAFRELAERSESAYEKECFFNIAWPTTEIQQASLYSRTPTPVVQRRLKQGDLISKDAAETVERAIDYCLDVSDFNAHMQRSVLDLLVAGLGTARVLYEVTTDQVQDPYGQAMEVISSQSVGVEFFSWKHFGWQPCKSWEDCEWVYFQHTKTKRAVEKEYDIVADEDTQETVDEPLAGIKVYEVYHRPSRSVIVFCEQFARPLEIRQDQLGLDNFFPCPKPMFCNLSSGSLMPQADFKYYSKQFKSLDDITKRTHALTKAMKAVMYYDAHFQELAKAKAAPDGSYIPVEDLVDKLEGSNLNSVIANLPLEQYQIMIERLNASRLEIKSEVYEILGISDIMRGESNPQDGQDTQNLKSQYGAVRIREKQGQVDTFVRDIFRLWAEIIGEHFEPQVLTKITGIEQTPEVTQVLRDDLTRNYSIDVETDSTNAVESAGRQRERFNALQTLVDYFSNIIPAMQNGALPQEVGKEMLLLCVRSLDQSSVGNLEDVITQMYTQGSPEEQIGQLNQQLQEMQGQLEQAQGQLQQIDMQAMQLEQGKTQAEIRYKHAQANKLDAEIPQVKAETASQQIEVAANATGQTAMLKGIE